MVAHEILKYVDVFVAHPHGILLIHWFLDSSNINNRYLILCHLLLPKIPHLCSTKQSHCVVLKLITCDQTRAILMLIFSSEDVVMKAIFVGGSVSEYGIVCILKLIQCEKRRSVCLAVKSVLSRFSALSGTTGLIGKLMEQVHLL